METLSHIFTYYTSLQTSYRNQQIRRFNAKIATKNPSSSILCLPDDVLLIIFDYLQGEAASRQYNFNGHLSNPECRGRCRTLVLSGQPQHHDGDLLRFSLCNRRIRRLAEPRIFKSVRMGSSWSPERASKALQSLAASGCARRYTRELSLDVWASLEVGEAPSRAKKLLKLGREFIQATQALKMLERLSLTLPEDAAVGLRKAVKKAGDEGQGTILVGVRELVLSPFMHWVIDFCPGVRSIESNDWVLQGGVAREDMVGRTIEAAGRAMCLEHFSVHCRWRLPVLRTVVEKMPGLKSLALRGGQYSGDMSQMLSVLDEMRSLERLELMDAVSVNEVLHHQKVHLRYWPPYLWEDKITEAQRNVVSKAFRELESLQSLCLGGYFTARVVRREAKRIDVHWEIEVCDALEARRMRQASEMCIDNCSHESNCGNMQVQAPLEHRSPRNKILMEYEDEEEEQLRLLREEMAM